MSLDLADEKSTLVQVMAWCHQATSHYLSQCWPRSLSPYGVTRPQWAKLIFVNERGPWKVIVIVLLQYKLKLCRLQLIIIYIYIINVIFNHNTWWQFLWLISGINSHILIKQLLLSHFQHVGFTYGLNMSVLLAVSPSHNAIHTFWQFFFVKLHSFDKHSPLILINWNDN